MFPQELTIPYRGFLHCIFNDIAVQPLPLSLSLISIIFFIPLFLLIISFLSVLSFTLINEIAQMAKSRVTNGCGNEQRGVKTESASLVFVLKKE